MHETPADGVDADGRPSRNGIGRLFWRGLRLLAVFAVVALLGLLIWDVQKAQTGSNYVSAIRGGKNPQAPAFDSPVLWRQSENWPKGTRLLPQAGQLSLRELRGTPVVLNFWASWCDACKAEAHVLTAAARRYSGQVAFLGMNVQDFTGSAKQYLRHYKTNYVSVRSTGNALYDAYGLTGLPETFFIDRQGRTIEHVIGATTQSELKSVVGKLITTRPEGRSAAHR